MYIDTYVVQNSMCIYCECAHLYLNFVLLFFNKTSNTATKISRGKNAPYSFSPFDSILNLSVFKNLLFLVSLCLIYLSIYLSLTVSRSLFFVVIFIAITVVYVVCVCIVPLFGIFWSQEVIVCIRTRRLYKKRAFTAR